MSNGAPIDIGWDLPATEFGGSEGGGGSPIFPIGLPPTSEPRAPAPAPAPPRQRETVGGFEIPIASEGWGTWFDFQTHTPESAQALSVNERMAVAAYSEAWRGLSISDAWIQTGGVAPIRGFPTTPVGSTPIGNQPIGEPWIPPESGIPLPTVSSWVDPLEVIAAPRSLTSPWTVNRRAINFLYPQTAFPEYTMGTGDTTPPPSDFPPTSPPFNLSDFLSRINRAWQSGRKLARPIERAWQAYQWGKYYTCLQFGVGCPRPASYGQTYSQIPSPVQGGTVYPPLGPPGPARFPQQPIPRGQRTMDLAGFFGGMTNIFNQVAPILERYGVLTPAPQMYPQYQPRHTTMPIGGPVTALPYAYPGGAPIPQGMATQAGLEIPFVDIAPQGVMSGMGGTCITPQARPGIGYPSTVQFLTPTPSGGTRVKTYKDKGTALLYSDDLAACKRVKRVAARARRAAGGR